MKIFNNLSGYLKKSFSLGLALLLTGGLFTGKSVSAIDILDNGNATIASQSIRIASQTIWNGVVFTPQSNFTLSSLQLVLVSVSQQTGDLTISLYQADGSNAPTGSVLASKTETGVNFQALQAGLTAANATQFDLTTGSWNVNSGSKYVLTISSNLTNPQGFADTNPVSFPTTSDATYLGMVSSSNSGSSWGSLQTGAAPWIILSGNTVPVPEPSTYVLGTIATGMIAYVSRHRKKQSA